MSTPTIASRLVVGTNPARAAAEAARAVANVLGGPADLVVVFASPELCRDPDAVRAAIAAELSPGHLIGCTGAGVVGTGTEVEDQPAIVVWGAILPGARITPIRAVGWRTPDGEIDVAGWPTDAGSGRAASGLPGADDVVVALADPYTFPIDLLLQVIAGAPWQPPVVGGLAAGGARPGEHVLWLDDISTHDGLVGVSIGGIELVTAVSQGCVGVGPEMVVTDTDGNGRIYALAGTPALPKLQEVLDDLYDRSLE
jgi:small ligand-binding sensory domain FIST